ncbi:MAG TPA: DinB family protein [Ktedonobacteraceae bacterium]|nr:DinB family protein [Ktedonobacteraceae bacterium]
MDKHPMETEWCTALWQQFGAAIDMLESALLACPGAHWNERLWSDQEQPDSPTFWYLTYHTLFWLDLYLTGKTEGFTPPAHFWNRFDPQSAFPKQPYTREDLHTYLKHLRQKCQSTLTGLSDEKAHQPFHFPWPGASPMSYLELQLYSMRHVQEHAAQLSLFLGRHGVPDEALDWVSRAKDEAGL